MKNVTIGVCTLIGIAGIVAGGMFLKKWKLTEQDIKEIDEMFEEAE